MYGWSLADEAKKQTKVIEDVWIPVWDEEFAFGLTVPELALLKIVVREHDELRMMTLVVKHVCLYRSWELRLEEGDKLKI